MAMQDEIRDALTAGGRSHQEFETVYLNGVCDKLWSGYYAAFVLGHLSGLDIAPSRLAALLEQVEGDDWFAAAAELIASDVRQGQS